MSALEGPEPLEPTNFKVDYKRFRLETTCCCECGEPLQGVVGASLVGWWDGELHDFKMCMGCWALFKVCAYIACVDLYTMPELGNLTEWIGDFVAITDIRPTESDEEFYKYLDMQFRVPRRYWMKHSGEQNV